MSHPAVPSAEAFSSLSQAWAFEPWVSVPIILAAGIYADGWKRLRQRAPQHAGPKNLGAFLSGLAVIVLALASPLHALGALLLQAHMLQHLLLMMVAPPLLWLGAPLLPMLHGLPRQLLRACGRPIFTCLPLLWLTRAFSHPVVTWLLFVISTWAWHVPRLYEGALASDVWHHLQHLSFLVTGLAFWWPVLQPYPSRPVVPRWGLILYLALADLQNTILAAGLVFSERVLYPTYDVMPRLWGVSALDDQAAAGALMWVPGSIAFLLPAAWIVGQLLSPQERSTGPQASLRHTPRRAPVRAAPSKATSRS
jgi:cytochrome c oxidase assembly factor CtaG